MDNGRCCTSSSPCVEGEGDCENNDECGVGLVCGTNNCKQFGDFFHERDDCCENSSDSVIDIKKEVVNNIPKDPPAGKIKALTFFCFTLTISILS